MKAGGNLEGALAGSGAMAGSDPAGMQWAASCDEAACGVYAVLIDLQTRVFEARGDAAAERVQPRHGEQRRHRAVYLPGKRAGA